MKCFFCVCTILTSILCGCGTKHDSASGEPQSPLPATSYELTVANGWTNDIFPVVAIGGRSNDMGVVAGDTEATLGFVPLSIGCGMVVTWAEGDLQAPKMSVNIPTSDYEKQAKIIKAFELQYKAERKWILKAYDGVGIRRKEVMPEHMSTEK